MENDHDVNECRTEEAGDLSAWHATTSDMPASGTDNAKCVQIYIGHASWST